MLMSVTYTGGIAVAMFWDEPIAELKFPLQINENVKLTSVLLTVKPRNLT